MRKTLFSFLLLSCLMLETGFGQSSVPLKILTPAAESGLLEVLPLEGQELLLLAPQDLYKRNGAGETKSILHLALGGPMKRIAASGGMILVLGSKGLLASEDRGLSWKNIAPAGFAKDETPSALEASGETVWLGTNRGLYSALLPDLKFRKIDSLPRSGTVLEIRAVSRNIYFVLTDRSLWKTRDGGLGFEGLLKDLPATVEKEEIQPQEIEEEPRDLERAGKFTSLAVSPDGARVREIGRAHV